MGLFGLILGPMVFSIWISFFRWNIISIPEFIGLDNYIKLLSDALFWKSLQVTVIYTCTSAPLRVAIAFVLAFLLNHRIVGRGLLRTIFYLPVMVSGVVLALMWAWIYNPDYGMLNTLLSNVGIEGPRWLGGGPWPMLSIILMSAWRVGGMMVIFLAGLQDIPSYLYDSADIDGASRIRKLVSITIPMVSPTVFFNLVISLIQSFQVFGEVQVLTDGGPANATLTYMINIYQQTFQFLKMGYGSALSWILMLIILSATLLLFRSSKIWVHYEGE